MKSFNNELGAMWENPKYMTDKYLLGVYELVSEVSIEDHVNPKLFKVYLKYLNQEMESRFGNKLPLIKKG